MAQITKNTGVYLEEFGKPLVVKQLDIPELQDDQVLIKIEAAPINPSDVAYIGGFYRSDIKPPRYAGFEGSGIVVQAKGEAAQALVQKKVGFYSDNAGTYAEYIVVHKDTVIPVPEETPFEQAACLVVNPFTVVYMLYKAQELGAKAVIHTAAASQLGRQMNKYFSRNGVDVINVVRRQEQVDTLKAIGAKYILNSSDADFDKQLQELSLQLGATVTYDAVGGDLATRILPLLPPKSFYHVYGFLGGLPTFTVGTMDLFAQKTVRAFWLLTELQNSTLEKKIQVTQECVKYINSDFGSVVAKSFTFDQFNEALQYQQQNQSEGKVYIKHN